MPAPLPVALRQLLIPAMARDIRRTGARVNDVPLLCEAKMTRPVMMGAGAVGLAVGLTVGLALTGCPGALPVTQAGLEQGLARHSQLFLPPGRGPFPGLVLLSGCFGARRGTRYWARRLTRLGYATLVVASMKARGLAGGVCGDGARLPAGERAGDAWWGFSYLARHPKIDRRRLGLIGWSHGAWTALAALGPRIAPAGRTFAAAVVFYPYCGDGVAVQRRVPLLMLLAGRDDWTPAEQCRQEARHLIRSGARLRVVVFPRARHAFDLPWLPAAKTIRRARRGQGATIGYDPAAAARAYTLVRQWLARHLGP
ncbi:MAG: dienelactone hydrolase family protein [Proteobacteria bacterium]|nr:dienelactone hydrolase family protein [Pseudomonadota bacterium]